MSRFLLCLGFALIAGGSLAVAESSVAQEPAREETLAMFSAMPKGPTWTRPAPTTWSSRANVRWQARWGGDARYMA